MEWIVIPKNNGLITKLINYLLLEVPMKYIPITPDNFRNCGQQEAQKKRFNILPYFWNKRTKPNLGLLILTNPNLAQNKKTKNSI